MRRPASPPTPGGPTPTRRRPRAPWLLLLALCLAMPAWAQTSDPAPAPPPTPEEEQARAEAEKLPQASEEIIVTARKREENVQEVPVAISVLTGEKLEESSTADLAELQASVPNLSIYSGRNQSTTLTAFLRGIGQADPLWGVDPGVGLYLDDVYIARPQGALLDVFDVQRIEVLRGPQGTLYGKNTIGGAIKYVSRDLTDELNGTIGVTGGEWNTQEVRAAVGGALVPGKLRARVAVASMQRDGYGENLLTGKDVSDKDTTAFRIGLDFLPTENVKLALSYDRTEDDSAPKGLTRLQANPFCPIFSGGACPPEQNLFDTRSGLAPLNGTTSSGYSAILTWDLGGPWSIKSITAYRESDSENNIDFDTSPGKIADAVSTYFDDQTSQELQLIYDGSGRFSGVFGAYYFDGEAGGLVRTVFLNTVNSSTDGDMKTESIAVFGDGTYRINDRLSLDLGLRATQEKKTARAFNTVNNVVFADFNKSKTFDSVAPKLGLNYRFTDAMMGYFTASRGFKSGGYNVRAQSNIFPESAEPFDDEILDVGEVGLKSTLADGAVVLNAAAFYGKYKDIQVSTFTSYDSNGDGTNDAFFGNFLNAGNATLKGIELEMTYDSAGWFGLSGNVSYLDATPDEFLDENRDGFVDTQVITNAPEWTGTLRANVDFPLFGGLLTGSLGYAYRDDSVLTNEGGPNPFNPTIPLLPITQDAYGLWDAWVSWLSPSASWRVGIAGKNLADEEYLTNGYNLLSLGILQGSYGAPRTVVATVEYRF